MTSRGVPRPLGPAAAAVAALALLIGIGALLWAGLALGFFDHKTPTRPPSTAKPTRGASVTEAAKEEDRVALVRPVKTSPPLHEDDLRLYGDAPGEPQQLQEHHSGHYRHRMAHIWDPHPQYEFAAFGQQFHLQLALNPTPFVLRDIKVTHVSENTSRLENLSLRADGCFYTGTVQDDPKSSVAVSLCHGMTGHIRTSNGSFMIEPAERWQGPAKSLLHRLYRTPHLALAMPEAPSRPHPPPGTPLPLDDIESAGEEEFAENGRGTVARRRRSAARQQENNIEIMVVADRRMAEYHQDGFEQYVLTLMNIVARIYKDASIGNPINIAVVKLFVLKDVELATRRPGERGASASEMLRRFCAWQEKHNDPDDRSKNHHDCALLLTRENICRNPSGANPNCETLGLAELGTMCDTQTSCAVVQDNGLSAAFTIAHELGHVLNMPHDDDYKCDPYRGPDTTPKVMSRMLDNNTDPWSWSECSRHFLTEYLEGGAAECLLDDPGTDHLAGDVTSRKFPGEDFTDDRQCELVFGPGTKICSYMPMCKTLWCVTESTEAKGCRTQMMPWADGTACGPYSWCQRGECVFRDPALLLPIDGAWGEWQSYGECSRSCGGGVKRAYRECNHPTPANGGRYCSGRRVKYKPCNWKECPAGSPDFRELQCAANNNNTFLIPGVPKDVKWVPKYGVGPEDRCKLYCRIAHSNAYYNLKEKVIDGTPCGPDTFDMCVNGVCRSAGCDHILGSKLQSDACGECGGNNSTCQQVYGSYNLSQYGYNRVVRIPAGAFNIDIRQYGYRNSFKDDNYLALVDGESGDYLLNGNSTVTMFMKVIPYGGTTLEFSGSGSVVERINSTRPINKDLIVEVLSVGNMNNSDIRYSYKMRHEYLARYTWHLSDQWSPCDKVCKGERQRVFECVRADSKQEVASDFCNGIDQPEAPKEECNYHCDLRWQVSRSECSNHCGPGTRVLMVQCVQQFSDYKASSVHNSSCGHLPRPPSQEQCVGPCDRAHWQFAEWGLCSKTCGTGVQRRVAVCVNDMNEPVDEKECRESERILERRCATQKCPHWAVGDWTPCSVTCGTGVRRRPYWCQLGGQVVTPADICGSDGPTHQESCRLADCASWVIGDWSACSVTCGEGIVTRTVMCNIPGACLPNNKPPVTETCMLHPCTMQHENSISMNSIDYHRYLWKTEDWQPCSVSCGEGVKQRALVCYDEGARKITDPNYCSHLEQPTTESGCLERACADWRVGEWSACSASCGQGVESRAVACMTDEREVDPRECVTSRPEDQRACITQCPEDKPHTYKWRTGSWAGCSQPCGGGTSTRIVVCQDKSGVVTTDTTMCRESKPVNQATCNTHPCNYDASWIFGAWSHCNKTCGGGYQHRQVRCQNSRGVPQSDSLCPKAERPMHTQPCNSQPCPRANYAYNWKVQDWSQCSVSCGTGVQSRSIICQRVNLLGWVDPDPMSPALCDAAVRPDTQQHCHAGSCTATYSWVPGHWQQCSHTCGKRGRQIRRLFCYHKNGKKVNRKNCPRPSRPQRKRKCNQKKCGFVSCKDVQQKTNHRKDKEYTMTVAGRNLSIYCHGMNTVEPVEFLTLPKGAHENYAEYYGYSLINPNQCPYQREPCTAGTCVPNMEGRAQHGFTSFTKIRLNITSLRVITHDWTFSRQMRGKRVPYGEGGDCYSRARCAKGGFSINLTGTGLRVSPHSQWSSHGRYSSIQVNKVEENRKVMGRCGGYCGSCSPEFGLKLDILPP